MDWAAERVRLKPDTTPDSASTATTPTKLRRRILLTAAAASRHGYGPGLRAAGEADDRLGIGWWHHLIESTSMICRGCHCVQSLGHDLPALWRTELPLGRPL